MNNGGDPKGERAFHGWANEEEFRSMNELARARYSLKARYKALTDKLSALTDRMPAGSAVGDTLSEATELIGKLNDVADFLQDTDTAISVCEKTEWLIESVDGFLTEITLPQGGRYGFLRRYIFKRRCAGRLREIKKRTETLGRILTPVIGEYSRSVKGDDGEAERPKK